ncbi:MAG: alpha/beta hydrolase [Methylobacteriaceae bacterium]|nr:alpha/beta hydrolase [Methylobacteriaceae bacterium]MBV9244597.1 alpha/beta hydrolase [Methylobacteriaceae bacterium]
MPAEPRTYESIFFSAQDGLRLHLRDYRPLQTASKGCEPLPVVCLPGLARTAGDFDRLALALSRESGPCNRRVVAIDYRGRGLSDRDRNPKNYDIFVENADILSALTVADIDGAVFVGTSRGGLHVMALAGSRPTVLRGAVLNDIGPVIEATGLARIRGYVGKMPRPTSWDEATALIKRIAAERFPSLSEADWEAFARLTYEDKDGLFVTQYDPALSKALESIDIEAPIPTLWPQFEALAHVPVLVVRGANSDLLSATTAVEMTRRHPDCELYVIEGQGHAPLLFDAASIARIARFIDKVENIGKASQADPAVAAASPAHSR